MGLFNNLMSKIFNHGGATSQGAAAPAAGGSNAAPAPGNIAQAGAPAAPGGAAAAPAQSVDVAAVLEGMAAKNSEKLDWKKSIVDLMKLVGMDSSLSARKELAKDLHYTGDTDDSATMNMWLHKEVMKKLAENGGKVPQELLS
ncbi:MAG: DUF3597 domain-containing protein [Chthoniobacterales bacterium]